MNLNTVETLLNKKEFIVNTFNLGDIDWQSAYTFDLENVKTLIKNKNIKLGVEIGSHVGESANAIIQVIDDCILVCVDYWDLEKQRGYLVPNIKDVYNQFLSNIVHYNISNKIVPIHMTSKEASKYLDMKFDFCYIDADHSEDGVYNDLCNWYPKLNDNGLMCGDDWIWRIIRYESKSWNECINIESHEYDFNKMDRLNPLRKGVKRFAMENDLNIFSIQNFWWLDKK